MRLKQQQQFIISQDFAARRSTGTIIEKGEASGESGLLYTLVFPSGRLGFLTMEAGVQEVAFQKTKAEAADLFKSQKLHSVTTSAFCGSPGTTQIQGESKATTS